MMCGIVCHLPRPVLTQDWTRKNYGHSPLQAGDYASRPPKLVFVLHSSQIVTFIVLDLVLTVLATRSAAQRL